MLSLLTGGCHRSICRCLGSTAAPAELAPQAGKFELGRLLAGRRPGAGR